MIMETVLTAARGCVPHSNAIESLLLLWCLWSFVLNPELQAPPGSEVHFNSLGEMHVHCLLQASALAVGSWGRDRISKEIGDSVTVLWP